MEPKTKEEIEQMLINNELIGRFMEVEPTITEAQVGLSYKEIIRYPWYNEDWNKLMEVWSRFRDMTFSNYKDQFEHSTHKEVISNRICNWGIKYAYEAIISAINWYNTTKQ